MSSEIHFIQRHQIDDKQWDRLIYESNNGLIYATTTYLDAMCDGQWAALVLGNYEAVMPLPTRKKYGIGYIYQPAFTQQSGIFSKLKISLQLIDKFIAQIPSVYRYIEINLNSSITDISCPNIKRKNYLLDISGDYHVLQKAYSRSANRNIKKAIEQGIVISENISAKEIITLHRQRFNDEIGATKQDYIRFERLVNILLQEGKCYTIGTLDDKKVLIAGSIYWVYKNRITFIFNGNSPQSLACGATHLLKDTVIKRFAEKGLLMDFEGSDFPQFARFYEQFGNIQIEYYSPIKINRLPWPLNWLKR